MLARFFILLILVLGKRTVTGQIIYPYMWADYDSAWAYKNLKIIPIRYKGPGGEVSRLTSNAISFNQALKRGLITVSERGTTAVENVRWLSLTNNSDKDVFVSSGEILAGGRQDRITTKDTLVKAKMGRIDLPVMCVEEGRWSEKDKKFTYKRMANAKLRKVLDSSKSQVQVWREIARQLNDSKINDKNLAYLAREKDKKHTLVINDYWAFFKKKFQQPDSNIVGIVCMSGNKIIGSDIFLTSNLFYDDVEPLVMGYIEEAVLYGSQPVTVTNERVKMYLDQFMKDEEQQQEFVKKNGKLFKIARKTVHITTY
jgi:hypothetical protein